MFTNIYYFRDLGSAVLQLQRETDRIVNVHELAAKQLLVLQRELSEFNNEQNNKRHLVSFDKWGQIKNEMTNLQNYDRYVWTLKF